MELIYVLTYKCNLHCLYCPVQKKDLTMSEEVINRSLELFDKHKIKKVKIFGGEPLLEYDKFKLIVAKLKKHKPIIILSTNGILLDKEKNDFLKKNKIKLKISLDGNRFTQLKNRPGAESFEHILNILKILPKETVFNFVIAPQTVKYFLYNFKYLFKLGIRRYNFLPAYYNQWTDSQLKILDRFFEEIILHIKKENLVNQIYIENIDNYSDLTFFNQALVVDVDGKIYNTNAFLLSYFEQNKKEFLIGDLNKSLQINNKKINNSIINKISDPQSVEINRKLDNILNKFIFKYKSIYE